MRTREKLTLEEKVALALELIKRERSLEEVRAHYRVSHTTAYKVRNAFLEGGRAALMGEVQGRRTDSLEQRVRALENLLQGQDLDERARPARASRGDRSAQSNGGPAARQQGNGPQVARKR